MKLMMPMQMPRSVVKALATIWKGAVPANIKDICYTYGDTCYTTSERLRTDLERHEMTHTKQQGADPDDWWAMYGRSPKFRYEQELEAYRVQYKYVLAKDGRIKAFEFAKHLARDMSSPMYGDMCTFNQALQDILRA